MNVIKSIFFLSIFGVFIYASDDDSGDQNRNNNDGRVSPYGLFPRVKIPSYIERYEERITQLEKKLSKKRLLRLSAIPLSDALEAATEPVAHPGTVIIDQVADARLAELQQEDDEDIKNFRMLCYQVSSINDSLSTPSREEDRDCPSQYEINGLIRRLVAIRDEYYWPATNSPDSVLVDPDKGAMRGEDQDVLKILGQNSTEGKRACLELRKTGSFKKDSLSLELPRVYSFMHKQNQASAVVISAAAIATNGFSESSDSEDDGL